jgi:hypothetical protein
MSSSRTTHPKIIQGLITKLATLEHKLSKKEHKRKPQSSRELKSPEQKYSDFFQNFKGMEISKSVYTFASIIISKVAEKTKGRLKSHEILKFFAGCFFIAFKFIEDQLKFYIGDYAKVVEMDQKLLEKIEVGIFVHILGFDLGFEDLVEREEKDLLALSV